MRLAAWHSRRFLGIRVGRRYFKLRDVNLHPLRFSERNRSGYRRIARIGVLELGIRYDRPAGKALTPPDDPSNLTC